MVIYLHLFPLHGLLQFDGQAKTMPMINIQDKVYVDYLSFCRTLSHRVKRILLKSQEGTFHEIRRPIGGRCSAAVVVCLLRHGELAVE